MRKSIVSAATALAVVATGLAATGIVLADRPAAAALSDVPEDCFVTTAAYRADGQRLTYQVSFGTPSYQTYPNDILDWVPSAQQQVGETHDETTFTRTDYAARPSDGRLYKVVREGRFVDGGWRIMSGSSSHLDQKFAGTRILAYVKPYLYRVAGSSLYRYKEMYVNGVLVLSAPVKLSGVGWDKVNTLTYERTSLTGTATVDVLIGTKTNGELKEWRINRATPTKIASSVLRSSGWASFTSLSTGDCAAHPKGRVLLGITAAGTASLHFDANKTDWSGTDIKGGPIGVNLAWTAKAYGQ